MIRASVTRLARDEGRDVVVVMHGHAGLAGSQGLQGLDKKSCSERGWKGGVVRLVYVCAFMFAEGWTQVPPGTGNGLVSFQPLSKFISSREEFADVLRMS